MQLIRNLNCSSLLAGAIFNHEQLCAQVDPAIVHETCWLSDREAEAKGPGQSSSDLETRACGKLKMGDFGPDTIVALCLKRRFGGGFCSLHRPMPVVRTIFMIMRRRRGPCLRISIFMLGSENSRSPEMLATKIGITHGRFSETGDQAVEGGRKYPDIFGIRSRSKQLLPQYSRNGGAAV